MNIPVYTISVVGVTFDARQKRIAALEDNAPVFFKAEPHNGYDPKAIAVLNEAGEHLGYVAKTDPKREQIRHALENGFVIARASKVGGFRKWNGSTAALGLRVQFYAVAAMYRWEQKDEEPEIESGYKRRNTPQKAKRKGNEWKDEVKRHHKGRYTYHEIEELKRRIA